MFEQLDVFRMSSAMAAHAGRRQAVIAQNVANADTPGYIAKDIAAFADAYGADVGGLRTTRAQHFPSSASTLPDGGRAFGLSEDASPNGNAVSIETEMLKSVDAKRAHDRALAIYKSALNVLRTTIGR